jgi:predicted ATPase
MVGRNESIRLIKDLISAFRVVTLAGPGGIGKTTLALELARDLLAEFNHSVFFVELSPLSDPQLVPLTVARALGLSIDGKELPAEDVARAIGLARALLVLDNCEHLVDTTARLAETIVRWCPHVSILVTSREVMKIDGERVHRLPPLEVPESSSVHLKPLLECSAVELFVRRTQSLNDGFALSTDNSAAIATICRHLDGIPLAIEFAAARTATLGVQQVVTDLRDRLGLLTSRRRTAIPRHKTLRAVLDWSYDLLSPAEQKFLRSLAVFSGPFNLDDASAIATTLEAADWLSSLVDKSLIASEIRASTTLYRLLDTTRAYAFERLKECDEIATVSRLHAEYHKDLFERIEPEWQTRVTAELDIDYAWRVDNVRTAIAWAFSDEHTAPIGVAMAAAAIPLWMHLSLVDECLNYLRQALLWTTAVEALPPERQVRLYDAYGVASLYSGRDPEAAESACEQALNIAVRIDDVDHQLKALWGLWLVRRGAIDLAHRFLALAVKPVDHVVGHRMAATSYHVRGRQNEARPHVDFVRANSNLLATDPARVRFLVAERPTSEEPGLAKTLWAQGCPDQAMEFVRQSIDTAMAAGHANSLCHFLSSAGCLIPLWAGRLEEAKGYIQLMDIQSSKYTLLRWRSWGLGYQGMLAIQTGAIANGIDLLRVAIEELRSLNEWRGHVFFPLSRATALGSLGRVEEGLALIDECLKRDDVLDGWMHPELFRAKGDLLMLGNTLDVEAAKGCFRKAMEEGLEQGALAWELRAATSLARLLLRQGLGTEAAQILQPVYDRYGEGFETVDVTSARALLEGLR